MTRGKTVNVHRYYFDLLKVTEITIESDKIFSRTSNVIGTFVYKTTSDAIPTSMDIIKAISNKMDENYIGYTYGYDLNKFNFYLYKDNTNNTGYYSKKTSYEIYVTNIRKI